MILGMEPKSQVISATRSGVMALFQWESKMNEFTKFFGTSTYGILTQSWFQICILSGFLRLCFQVIAAQTLSQSETIARLKMGCVTKIK